MAIPAIITAAIANTTSTNPVAAQRVSIAAGAANRISAVLLALVLGAALLYLGGPRFLGAFYAAPGDPILRRIRDLEPVDGAGIARLGKSREDALAKVEDGRIWAELGHARLLLAYDVPAQSRPDLAIVRQARWAISKGLELAPVDPEGWVRLAYTEILLSGSKQRAAGALSKSIDLARYAPRLTAPRLQLSLGVWPYFTEAGRVAVRDQIRLLWRDAPERLVALAVRSGRVGTVRAALATEPAALFAFQIELEKRAR